VLLATALRDAKAEVARWRHKKLYKKAMLMYCVLSSEEERAAMVEPISWQPVLDTNVSMEEHVHVLQVCMHERFPQPLSEPPVALPSPPAMPHRS
jgi:hypothetical protein